MEEKPEFRSISLKANLVNQIEQFLKKSGRYRSIADFVSEAARIRLEELEKTARRVESEVPTSC